MISIVTTLLFSFPSEILIYLSILLLLIGNIVPLGRLAIFLTDFIKEAANFMSAPEWVLASADYIPVRILTYVFTVLLILFLILDIKKKKIGIAILSLLFASIFTVSAASTLHDRGCDEVYTQFLGNSDTILVKSNSSAYAIYNGDTSIKSSYNILNVLNNEKLTHLDELVLTSISEDFSHSLCPIIDNIRVGIIRVPNPVTEYEFRYCEALSEMLSLYGTTLRFYANNLTLSEYNYELVYRTPYLHGKESEAVYKISSKSYSYVYLTSGAANIAPINALKIADKSDLIIIGASGDCNKKFDLKLTSAKMIIVNGSVDISNEASEYYRKRAVEICSNSDIKALFE